ncbi:hypothetical protein CIHG_04244 [Coccidioides immitis H538.4]|uniref:Uncharacterized protein n=3 Tax=Coccidioides immitis TaxID=5501 RepID=A0A0J8TW64_COCIT|nr:hypothetical protein CIRG_04633 [Coccidioides immitis RMSCC 2394]KMU78147.1 hypothetical protein CISG_06988 [Coccidioides immitis RMSCC 3703]KMU86455.1 hypothetical protein CIHG_04244 [Coccidioides immitis H538.4]
MTHSSCIRGHITKRRGALYFLLAGGAISVSHLRNATPSQALSGDNYRVAVSIAMVTRVTSLKITLTHFTS